MKTRVATFPTVSCCDKLLTVLIVFCFFVNGFVPHFSIDANDCAAVSRVLSCQSTLFQFISCSSLPLKIVNDLFARRNALPLKKSGHPGRDDTRNSANTASDYSLFSPGGNLNMNRLACGPAMGDTFAKTAGGVSASLTCARGIAEGIPIGEGYAFLLIILFFFLLPRSSVPDGASHAVYTQIPSAQLAHASWVFYWEDPAAYYSASLRGSR